MAYHLPAARFHRVPRRMANCSSLLWLPRCTAQGKGRVKGATQPAGDRRIVYLYKVEGSTEDQQFCSVHSPVPAMASKVSVVVSCVPRGRQLVLIQVVCVRGRYQYSTEFVELAACLVIGGSKTLQKWEEIYFKTSIGHSKHLINNI